MDAGESGSSIYLHAHPHGAVPGVRLYDHAPVV